MNCGRGESIGKVKLGGVISGSGGKVKFGTVNCGRGGSIGN